MVMPVDLGAGLSITMPSTPCSAPQPFVPSFKPRTTCKPNSGGLCSSRMQRTSFGATFAGQPVGSQADITGFSFHAVKNLTTAEGGALAFSLPDSFDMEAILGWFKAWPCTGNPKALWKNHRQLALRRGGRGVQMQHDGRASCHWPCTTPQIPDHCCAGRQSPVRTIKGSAAARGTKVRPLKMHCVQARITSFSCASTAFQQSSETASWPTSRREASPPMSIFNPRRCSHCTDARGEHVADYPESARLFEESLSLPIHLELTDDDVTRIIRA